MGAAPTINLNEPRNSNGSAIGLEPIHSAAMADDAPSNQQRILDAAKSLFLKKGYNGSNLRDIAREARVSMGGIYHHFASKEEIYTTLLQSSDAADDLFEILGLFRKPEFPENLAEIGDGVARVVRKHRDSFKLFYIDVLEFEGKNVTGVIQSFRDGLKGASEVLLAHRKDDLIDVHPALLMRMMVDVFLYSRLEEAMLDQPIAPMFGISDEDLTSQMAQVLLRGMLRR